MESKNQFCELCRRAVSDVEPAQVSGRRRILMVCKRCLAQFERTKLEWGNEKYQYYWDLGWPVVEGGDSSPKGKREYILVGVSKRDIIRLRAAGFHIQGEKYEDQSDVPEG